MASLALMRLAGVPALATVLAVGAAACSPQSRRDPGAGRAEAKQACELWNAALQDLSADQATPLGAAARIREAAAQSDRAAAKNSTWRTLSGDLRFAANGIEGLDPERLRTETGYLFDGPAEPLIDAVNRDCEQAGVSG